MPQWQRSKGSLILMAAIELSSNQITHFYSTKKNTDEMIRMMEVLIAQYRDRQKLYLSWDAASWHVSKKLFQCIDKHNFVAGYKGPTVETAPLPARAQFLNVIESIFSGMSRAIIYNSNYQSVDEAKIAIDPTSLSAMLTSENIHGAPARRFGARNPDRPISRNSIIAKIHASVNALSHQNDCDPHHRVLIAPISGSRLWKTGIFAVLARDFHGFRS